MSLLTKKFYYDVEILWSQIKLINLILLLYKLEKEDKNN